MAMRYYDDAIANKIGTWVTDETVKVLKPNETTRMLQIWEDEHNDKPVTLPIIMLSRDTSLELDLNVRNSMSFSGYKLNSAKKILTLDAIPVTLNYQLDIYTRKYVEGDEYLRNFVFGIINNPKLEVYIPYNNTKLKHVCYMRLLPTITDNSDIAEKLFNDQFTRWTLQIELQDAYFFNVPAHNTWKIDSKDAGEVEITDITSIQADYGTLQLVQENDKII